MLSAAVLLEYVDDGVKPSGNCAFTYWLEGLFLRWGEEEWHLVNHWGVSACCLFCLFFSSLPLGHQTVVSHFQLAPCPQKQRWGEALKFICILMLRSRYCVLKQPLGGICERGWASQMQKVLYCKIFVLFFFVWEKKDIFNTILMPLMSLRSAVAKTFKDG